VNRQHPSGSAWLLCDSKTAERSRRPRADVSSGSAGVRYRGGAHPE